MKGILKFFVSLVILAGIQCQSPRTKGESVDTARNTVNTAFKTAHVVDSCHAFTATWLGKSWKVDYTEGAIEINSGHDLKRFITRDRFTDCLDFSFKGLFVKMGSGWQRTNIWASEKIMIIAALDGLGRCVVFTLNLATEKIVLVNDDGTDVMMCLFNNLYLNPGSQEFAVFSEYEEDSVTHEVMTNMYFIKIGDQNMELERIEKYSKIKYDTIMALSSVFKD
jgi:hypothetical protein